MKNLNNNDLVKSIKENNFDLLSQKIYSEMDLKYLSKHINNFKNKQEIIYDLINSISKMNRYYDWNVGSILQHLDVTLIINSLKKINLKNLYNSIGLTWALGEFSNKNRIIVNYLYSVVWNSKNSEAWWRAAFALEKLTEEEAVNLLKMSLKNQKINKLDFYLKNLKDKKSIIFILILSDVDNIKNKIYPKIKKVFMAGADCVTIINCCWLIGRLKLIDQEIYKKLLLFIEHSNYELKYYTFFALQNNPTEQLRPIMEKALKDTDPLIRKMATRSLLNIGNERSLMILESVLCKEKDPSVVCEITESIYGLKNPINRNKLLIGIKSYKNENGMIVDESDKWYGDPAIYHIFSEAEDPENVCFNLIYEKIKLKKIINPIDLATGTGRILWQIIKNIKFDGELIGVDFSENMCNFIKKLIKRERFYTNDIKIIQSSIKDLNSKIKIKSNFIISSFGFPSKIKNKKLCLEELKTVYSLLREDGVFCTIGWDETFNDELSLMWYKYIPDNIRAQDFEEWRKKRSEMISSPRNCNLSWFKKGIKVPLQFTSLAESANVMGHLFGRDAAYHVIKNGKIEWSMHLGITFNTKKEIKKIIKSYERS